MLLGLLMIFIFPCWGEHKTNEASYSFDSEFPSYDKELVEITANAQFGHFLPEPSL